MSEKRITSDAVEILDHLYVKDDTEMQRMVELEWVKSEIAQQAYDLRLAVELTQEQLALKIGTTAEVIDNLEETDYEDHKIGDAVLMLHRIAKALDKQVEFRIVPLKTEPTERQLRSESPQGRPAMS